MNIGMDLNALATELTRQASAKVDYLAPTKAIEMLDDTSIQVDGETMPLTGNAHSQLATFAGIPQNYYRKLADSKPELLADNVNHWLQKSDKTRMVRALDEKVRAFLSDRYLRIDNDAVATMALQTLFESGAVDVKSTGLTNDNMYIKALFPALTGEPIVGDVFCSGVMIKGSETGKGSLVVEPFTERYWCTNGCTHSEIMDFGFKRVHLGAQLTSVLSDEAKRADIQAIMLQLRDVIKASSDPKVFMKVIDQLKTANDSVKIAKPVDAVERLAKAFNLNETEGNSVLENLIKDQNYSKYGLMNAVTQVANKLDSYTRSSEIEVLGGKVLNLNTSQWNAIAA